MQLKTKVQKAKSATKRGDTIVEVVFAFAIFCMVAIISIAMMNMGIAASERSLELVTARNELNAQAEALRFVHSSYIAEMSLPTCSPSDGPEVKCQQYRSLWQSIIDRSVSSTVFSIVYPPEASAASGLACDKYYEDNELVNNNAFVLNARQLLAQHNLSGSTSYNNSDALIPADSYSGASSIFVPASLNARIIYADTTGSTSDSNSTTEMQSLLTTYTRVAKVEGLWVVAVKGPNLVGATTPSYYDFYIQTCWYGSGNSYPTALDTIIRLYNPQGASH